MSTLVPPKLLLLDEHTAALDPSSARKVMDITNSIISQHQITALMITHNIKQALETGNRTIMLDNGSVLFDMDCSTRKGLTAAQLEEMYSNARETRKG